MCMAKCVVGCICLHFYQLCRRVPLHVIFTACLPDMTLDRTVGNQACRVCISHGACLKPKGGRGVINLKGLNNHAHTDQISVLQKDCKRPQENQDHSNPKKGNSRTQNFMDCLTILSQFLSFNIRSQTPICRFMEPEVHLNNSLVHTAIFFV